MNRNFAKPREDMTPEFAPDVLEINGRKVYNPKAVHYRRRNRRELRNRQGAVWTARRIIRKDRHMTLELQETFERTMMDVLTRRIHRNQGTGAFGYGNDLKYPISAE